MDVGKLLSTHHIALVHEQLEEVNIEAEKVVVCIGEFSEFLPILILPSAGRHDLVQGLLVLLVDLKDPLNHEVLCPPPSGTGTADLKATDLVQLSLNNSNEI